MESQLNDHTLKQITVQILTDNKNMDKSNIVKQIKLHLKSQVFMSDKRQVLISQVDS